MNAEQNGIPGNAYSATKRKKWLRIGSEKHGFSQCSSSKAKLVYFIIKKKATLEDIQRSLHNTNAHKDIANIRKYAQLAVREAIGLGVFDNYIIKYKLWNVRQPVIAEGGMATELNKRVQNLYESGERIHELGEMVSKEDKTLLRMAHIMEKEGPGVIIGTMRRVLNNGVEEADV